MIKTIVIFFVLLAANAYPATYYIKNGGNDESAGTSHETAWASLYKASTATSNGDTLYLNRGDTWTVTINRRTSCAVGIGLTFVGSGGGNACAGSTPTANITIGAYGTGDRPIIDASAQTETEADPKQDREYAPINIGGYGDDASGNFTISDLDIRGPDGLASQFYASGGNLTLSNIKITANGDTTPAVWIDGTGVNLIENCEGINSGTHPTFFEFYGGSDGTARGNVFSGLTAGGFVRWANNWDGTAVIENNYFEPIGCDVDHTYTTVVRSMSGTGTVIVRNNIYNLIGSTCGDTTALEMFYNDSPTTYFYNNTVIGNNDHAVINGYGTLYFNNNIVYDTAEICKQTEDDLAEAYNNIVYSVASDIDSSCGTVNESGTSTSNPNLVDPTFSTNDDRTDAYLTPLSIAAIDAGTGTPGSGYYPTSDIAGDTRSGTLDIGADEYSSGGVVTFSMGTTLIGITQ